MSDLDLRMPALAAVVWGTSLLAFASSGLAVLVAVLLASMLFLRRTHRGTVLAWLLLSLSATVSVGLHEQAASGGSLRELVHQSAQVSGVLTVVSDPKVHSGQFSDYVTLRGTTSWVTGRGARHWIRAPVLVIAPTSWRSVELGSRLRFSGRLKPPLGGDLAGVVQARTAPTVIGRPGWVHRAAGDLRAAIRHSVHKAEAGPRQLLPALVDGDDGGLPQQVVEDFRASGLTHLTAVSGANLTLACGFLILLARWAGVRRRGLIVVGLLGVIGFVLLARAEPSVIRAAAMGSAALIGLASNGRNNGIRAWGVAVTLLVLFDPWLARNIGFALSAVATAAILWLAPGWRDALMHWLPRWAAEAIAVPLAAQIGCTPLIAAISGQVSLVAVLANLLAAPAVAPATVLGLIAGGVTLINETVGGWVAMPAVWCCRWLIVVADRTASMPVSTIDWSARPTSLALLTIGCVVASLFLGDVLRRRIAALIGALLLVLVIMVPMPTPGWPAKGWLLVACDVTQGDGLVLNAGNGAVVVVDTGPDPDYIDQCLDRLGITSIPLVVVTHFHNDHAGGIEGVVRGRRVGQIEVTTLAAPLSEVRRVEAVAAAAQIPVRRVVLGEQLEVGQLRWRTLGPPEQVPESDSPPNDASIAMLVHTRGITMLLTGDQEPPSQRTTEKELGAEKVDVLKVAHHGSAKQDTSLIEGLGARLAVISVGQPNDYGHPAPSTLALFKRLGIRIARTDQDGDLAVVLDQNGKLGVVGRGHPRRNTSLTSEG